MEASLIDDAPAGATGPVHNTTLVDGEDCRLKDTYGRFLISEYSSALELNTQYEPTPRLTCVRDYSPVLILSVYVPQEERAKGQSITRSCRAAEQESVVQHRAFARLQHGCPRHIGPDHYQMEVRVAHKRTPHVFLDRLQAVASREYLSGATACRGQQCSVAKF